MVDVVILEGIRTPFRISGGALGDISAVDLGKIVLRELLERVELPPNEIDEVIWGYSRLPSESGDLARIIARKARVGFKVPTYTVQRKGAAGLQAVMSAFHEIVSENAVTAIAGAVAWQPAAGVLAEPAFAGDVRASHQSTRLVTRFRPLRRAFRHPFDASAGSYRTGSMDPQILAAVEHLAQSSRISRQAQDEYAALSHHRAMRAISAGYFKSEIVPLFHPEKAYLPVDSDEALESPATPELLESLPPLLDQPGSTVTSGNIAPVSDGAAAVLLMNAVRARELGIPPLGRIRLCAFTGVQPADSAISAAHAAARVLRQGNMTLRDVDLIEMNEPSAAEVLANERCFLERKLSQQRFGDARLFERYDRDKLNPNGGGIAIGLPPGVAGTRMIINALKEMKRRNLEIALVAMSSGNGQGGAMILERV